MKFLVSQLTYLMQERQSRRNLRALLKYLAFVVAVILVHSLLFHVIMEYVEGQEHSWFTGFYWTLITMSTLGFGDIVFHTDLGRLYTIVVLLSGMVLLLIMLPFAFIEYFYAPWLEARTRLKAPRSVPPEVSGHVIICRYDSVARGLIHKLDFNRIPYFVLEPDPVAAASLISDDVSALNGELDRRETYERLRLAHARMVFANADDPANTNITLTVRELDPKVPICALAEDEDSIDILELSGATQVLPLKRKLGEHLAARISAGADRVHVVGGFQDLQIAEFVANGTAFVGQTLRETRLRELTGANVVGVWNKAQVQPARPDLRLSDSSVPVVVGTGAQIERLNELLTAADPSVRPVLVIGGGKVGRAVAQALKRRKLPVHLIEKSEQVARHLRSRVDRLVVGDAADRDVLLEAGLEEAGAVALSTNNDGINIYLAVYCRRLKPELEIVSRVTQQRNIEAIYRAGVDSALSYASLGKEYVISFLLGRQPVMIGEGIELFLAPVPEVLAGTSLGDSRIGARTGLIVVAIENGRETLNNPPPATPLPAGGRLVMLGSAEQRQAFAEAFE